MSKKERKEQLEWMLNNARAAGIDKVLARIAKEIWDNDVPEAKFKMGQEVKYMFFQELPGTAKIIGINFQDEDSIEYCLEDMPFIFYEEELKEID